MSYYYKHHAYNKLMADEICGRNMKVLLFVFCLPGFNLIRNWKEKNESLLDAVKV